MKHISSRDNPQIKWMQRVAAGKEDGLVMLEGEHLLEEWLRLAKQTPEYVLFDEARLEQRPALRALLEQLDPSAFAVLAPNLMQRISAVAQGQGVCLAVRPPQPPLPQNITASALWLDRVQDPGNVGTLLRTAAAAGIGQVFLSSGCASAWSAKVLRSAQGAHFALAVHEQVDLLALCDRLSVPLAVTTLEGGQSLFETRLPDDIVWVAGHEGQGVDAALQARANLRVYIPQAAGVESLNVAVTTGICLFEQARQVAVRHN